MGNNYWTPQEEEALRSGVKKHGFKWKYILSTNAAVFRSRSNVDLKDKWRNMEKASRRAGEPAERRETRSGVVAAKTPAAAGAAPPARAAKPAPRVGRTLLQQAGDEEAAERAGREEDPWRFTVAAKPPPPRREDDDDDDDDDDAAARLPDDDAGAALQPLPERPLPVEKAAPAAKVAEKAQRPKAPPPKGDGVKAAPPRARAPSPEREAVPVLTLRAPAAAAAEEAAPPPPPPPPPLRLKRGVAAAKVTATQTSPEKAHAATSPPRWSQLEAEAPPRHGAAAPKAAAKAVTATAPLRQLAPPPQRPEARPAPHRPEAPKRVAFADQPPRGAARPADSDADDDGGDSDAWRAASPPRARPRATPYPMRRDARADAPDAGGGDVAKQLELLRFGFLSSLNVFSEPVSDAAREVSRELRQLTRALLATEGAAPPAPAPAASPPRARADEPHDDAALLKLMSPQAQAEVLRLAARIQAAQKRARAGDDADDDAHGDVGAGGGGAGRDDDGFGRRPQRARRDAAP